MDMDTLRAESAEAEVRRLQEEIERLTRENAENLRGMIAAAEQRGREVVTEKLELLACVEAAERRAEAIDASIQDMAKEYHALLNEPMYAGTRADWRERALTAESRAEALKGYARHKGTCGITLCIICNFGPIETHTPCNCTCGLSALLSEPV